MGKCWTKTHDHRWTEADRAWLIEANTRCSTYQQIVDEFNASHDDQISKMALQTYFKRTGIKRPYNHGEFTEASRPRILPIGSIRKSHVATYIKVADTLKRSSGYRKPDWIPLQEKIWMDSGRELPEGKMLIFLDGNRENFDLDNIYPISRYVSAIMACNQWYDSDPERTMLAIKWCELKEALRGNDDTKTQC